MDKAIRVAVADDHRPVLIGVGSWLDETDGMELVGTAFSPDEMLEVCEKKQPDVAIVDLVYRQCERPDLPGTIKSVSPDTLVLVYSGFTHPSQVLAAFECGADGYLSKEPSSADLPEAIRKTIKLGHYIDPCIARILKIPDSQVDGITRDVLTEVIEEWQLSKQMDEAKQMVTLLTDREKEILAALIKAQKDVAAAAELKLGEADFKNRISSIRKKLRLPKAKILELFQLLQSKSV